MPLANHPQHSGRRFVPVVIVLAACLMAPAAPVAAQCNVTADVVAMDQVITYNRMAAFNPAGMIFALARDVFPDSASTLPLAGLVRDPAG